MSNSIEDIFLKTYNKKDGVYECLPNNFFLNEIKKADINAYNFRADFFNENQITSLSDRHIKSIKPILNLKKRVRILELGGGDGRFGFYLLKQGYKNIIESDISYKSVKTAQKIARKNGLNEGSFCVIDTEKLPFKNNSIDAIFMVASLHHIPSPVKAIKEAVRVLKRGGNLLILKEPAAWQYYFFYPVFKIIKKIIRKNKNNPVSLADDRTFGFTKRKIYRILKPHFKKVKIIPVQYTEKIYINLLLLINKLIKKDFKENKKLVKFLRNLDKIIARIPILKNFTWDWDIYAFNVKK